MEKSITSDIKIKLTRMIIVFLGSYIFDWRMVYEGSDAIWDYLELQEQLILLVQYLLL